MSDNGGVTLVEFLLNAIAEDEAVARESFYPKQRWYSEEEAVSDLGRDAADDDLVMFGDRKADARHIARWDPARVLSECESKRGIIYDVEEHLVSEHVLKYLALPYCDRPGYDMAWTP